MDDERQIPVAEEQALRISEPGNGILFTVPISSATAFTAASNTPV